MVAVLAGATSVLREITVYNSTTGAPLPGLSSASSGITGAYRVRGHAGAYTTFTLTSTGSLGTWASGWFKEVDAANAPGVYEVGLPNQFTGTGLQGDYVEFVFSGASSMSPASLVIDIVAYNPQSGVNLGLSNLDATISSRATSISVPTNFGLLTIDGTGRVVASSVAGAVGSVTGNVGGNVNGTVGSVVGNVGGNVVGSVGSVTGAVGSVTNPVTIGTVNGSASNIKKNQALNGFVFEMKDSTNHNPDPGLTVTATRSLDAGSYSACANSVTGLGNGLYAINLAAGDLNGNTVALRFTATGADDLNILIITQP